MRWTRSGDETVVRHGELRLETALSSRDDEIDEEFRQRLTRAAAARAGDDTALLLSGGLDSSAILAALRGAGVRLKTVSMSLPGACDERPWSDAVVAHLDCAADHLVVQGETPELGPLQFERALYEPSPAPTALVSVPVRRAAVTRGARTLLNGLGADEIFYGSASKYADLLRDARLLRAAAEWWRGRRDPGYAGAWPSLLSAFAPLLPDAVKPAMRVLRRTSPVPSTVSRTFARRVGLEARVRGVAPREAFTSLSQRDHYRAVSDGSFLSLLELGQAISTACGAVESYPYLDRDVVEFALSLPAEQLWRGAEHKFIMRRAMRGHLPAEVVSAPAFFDFTYLLLPALREAAAGPPVSGWRVAQAGWIDERTLMAGLARITSLPDASLVVDPGRIWDLWNVVAVERLMAAIDGYN